MSKTYNIAVVPGDGIGPEVCDAAIKVANCAIGDTAKVTFTQHPGGGQAFLDTGSALPDDTLTACRQADAVLHGAVGMDNLCHPDGTEVGQDFSMKIRAELDLYANVRPIRSLPGSPQRLVGKTHSDINFTLVRENTEGLYAARSSGVLLRDELATDTLVMTRKGVERIVHMAAKIAQSRDGAPLDGVRRVTIVDKSNVLRSFAFFRKVADEVLESYPDIEVDHVIVDAMALHMIERPERFDVVVCENLLGDILSDLGAGLIGGLGLAPSGEMGAKHGYFQGSHGSAPDIAGKAIANPIATILSAAMMFDWLGGQHADKAMQQASVAIRKAVSKVLVKGHAVTRDLGGDATTHTCADAICAALAANCLNAEVPV